MSQVFLILAHEDAVQLAALVRALAPAGSPHRAVVHIDGKSPLWRETRGTFLAGEPNATVLPRPVAVRWGHASQIAATRLLLAEALRKDFAQAHLISGADWPLVSPERMAADGGTLCHIEAVPGIQSERMKRVRLDARWLRPDPARPLQRRGARALRRLSALIPPRRAAPWGPWHKGSQWWSLPRDGCEEVLSELTRAFDTGVLAGTLCADEHLIQTIAASRWPLRLAPNRRFIRWTGGASPALLGAADWAEARASGAWFARKLARGHDAFFLDAPLEGPSEGV